MILPTFPGWAEALALRGAGIHRVERPGLFVCFEGIDGSGKSTIAQAVNCRLRLGGLTAVLLDKKTVSASSIIASERLRALSQMLWDYAEGDRIKTLGDRHLIHLLVSWFYLFNESVLRPQLKTPQIVLVDGWIYKYIARFSLKPDFKTRELLTWLEKLETPDLILLMAIDAEVAWRRKGGAKLTESETALSSANEANRFISYQRSVQQWLRRRARANSWRVVASDGDIEAVTIRVIQELSEVIKDIRR